VAQRNGCWLDDCRQLAATADDRDRHERAGGRRHHAHIRSRWHNTSPPSISA